MTVPAAKVKALCTSAEASLVRTSRKADLARLDRAEVKKLADRARALRDKWRDLNRRQPRGKAANAEAATNSNLKEEIFREAQDRFDARLAQLDKGDAAPAGKSRPKITKERRAAEHRATRAAVRKGMAAAENLINVEKRREVPAPKAKKTAVPEQEAVATPAPPIKKGASRLKAPPVKPTKGRPPVQLGISKGKQRQAVTAAKQARVAKSGKTTRLRAHIKSQGKRTQARRDAK
ncbi:MAG TPA: hypothetical protein VHD36_16800 [Pirellulales bacterium]|nr:hypothetical protein [Pirellulales bacterium]